MKNALIPTIAALLLLFSINSFADGEGAPVAREYQFQPYSIDIHQRPPLKYVKAVPAEKKRRGLAEHIKANVTSSFNSQYVSRELPFSKGPVWQPSATVELYNFGFNVWSNFVLNDEANQWQFNEIDFTPYYTAHIGNLTIHPYFIFEVYPNGNQASLDYTPAPIIEGDIYVQYNVWKFDLFGRMRARIKQVAGEVYANVGAGFSQSFKNNIKITSSALLNMGNEKYLSAAYGNIDTNIDAISFMAAASWKHKGLELKPNANIAVHVVPEIRRAIRNNPNLNTYLVWGGLDVSYNF